jgi:hypothetical protein
MGARLAVVIVVTALLLSGCGGAASTVASGGSWGAEAEAWTQALHAAIDRHDLSHAVFYSPGVEDDSTMLGQRYYAEGRHEVLMMESELFEAHIMRGPLYLDPTAAAHTTAWVWSPTQAYGVLAYMEIGESGIDRLRHLAATWYQQAGISRAMVDAADVAISVATEYVRAWNAAEESQVRSLYAPGARVTDGLHGIAVTGVDAVASLAESSTVQWEVDLAADTMPSQVLESNEPFVTPDDAPLVFQYLEPTRNGDLSEVWVMLHSTTPCPGSMLVALTLDHDRRIVDERRFHTVESERDCRGQNGVADGWWTDRPLPSDFAERVTGSVVTPSGEVEMRNGSPETDEMVRWVFQRYVRAGLAPPEVASIAFDPYDDRCAGPRAYADWTTGTTEILVCADSASVRAAIEDHPAASTGRAPVSPSLAQLLLHEVSHAWLVTHADNATTQAFMREVGVDAWNDPSDDWGRRGVEWAAETLVWGLLGRDNTRRGLGSPSCAVLADGFRLLTQAEPLTPCEEEP